MNLCFLRFWLFIEKPSDFSKYSRVIGEKCVHPDLQIQKITGSLKFNGDVPHPLYAQKTLEGHSNYGIFATKKITAGTEIGEYVGEVYLRNIDEPKEIIFDRIPFSEYAWIIQINKVFLIINAKNIANELALINDYRGIRPKPNVEMQLIIHEGAYYSAYVSICDIQEGEELVVDYGDRFWDAFQKRKN
jgi:hypothetical protein